MTAGSAPVGWAEGDGMTSRAVLRGHMYKDPDSRRPEAATANGFANETDRDGGDGARHQQRSSKTSPWSARRAGTSKTRKPRVGRLIIQRSRVQIPPPATKARGPVPN